MHVTPMFLGSPMPFANLSPNVRAMYILPLAAALCANWQPGFDMVYPFLFGTSVLVRMKPNPALFREMDPFLCKLLKADDGPDFTIPIVRIVFTLAEKCHLLSI
jgi:hypothetical protein